uniref:Uncharacterized protein n=1 Tax=Romanomermis culicivorax TaxID=13658 RepID=A0A915L7D3_ROMCU
MLETPTKRQWMDGNGDDKKNAKLPMVANPDGTNDVLSSDP